MSCHYDWYFYHTPLDTFSVDKDYEKTGISSHFRYHQADASGRIEVHLLHYENKQGQTENGYCCETFDTIWCWLDKCDPLLSLCLDPAGGDAG